MISLGSREGRKGLGLRYGVDGAKMELGTELEEGEAYFENNNGDDSTIDLDVALSYIDEKLQNVLGHFQKDFEGGVSAENLGAKFGGYGSFLPTYQRSPVCPLPKTPPKVLTYSAPKSPNNLHIEGGHQNSGFHLSASEEARHEPASINGPSVPAPKGLSVAGKVKQEVPISFSQCSDELSLNGRKPDNNFANASDQTTLKVRLKVSSDNLSTRKKAEIYSGLGLDVSPSSSLEASSEEGIFHATQDGPHESISSILEMMTSFPVSGSRLLSPLPYDLLYLTKKEKCQDDSCGLVHKGSQESIDKPKSGEIDRKGYEEKKSKLSEKNYCSMKSKNGTDVCNDIGVLARQERHTENLACEELVSNAHTENLACEELVSNALKLPLLSNNNVVDLGKGAALNGGLKNELSDVAKEEPLDPVLIQDVHGVEKTNFNEKNSKFSKKVDLDVSNGSKTLDTELLKPPKKKAYQKVPPREKETVKLTRGKETSIFGGKKSPNESLVLENGSHDIDVLQNGLRNDDYSSFKSMKSASKSHTEVLKKSNGKARETYKEFFGEFDLEQEDDDDMGLEEKPYGEEKSKESIKGKTSQKSTSSLDPIGGSHIPAVGNGSVSDAMVAPVVNEDWVCCDKCEKWRLLPPGLNPGSLPEKWLCSMLDWLPGMNRCSISEEETTKAITSRFHGPTPPQGSHAVYPLQLGVIPVDPLHHGQPYQNFRSEALSAGIKKKKNLQTSHKSRSLNGANQSLSINGVEFQDSGQSSRLIAEKHKKRKKLRENFTDEGDNVLQSNIRNKREASLDYSRDSKKVKHGSDEDWASDHGGAVFKASRNSTSALPAVVSKKDHQKPTKDSKSALKVSVKISENQNQNQMNSRDTATKRKLNEFEEETSADHRKEKKAKLSKSGADKRGTNVKDEQLRSLNVQESSKRNVLPVQALMAATSSSSKVSSSHKIKPNNQEAKGSPVESVSSSPRRILNPQKFTSSRTNIGGIDDGEDANGSHQRKNAKGSSSRYKDKINKVILKNTELVNEENSKGGRNHSQEKPSVNSEKFEKGYAFKKGASGKPSSESAKRNGQLKHEHSLPSSGKGQNEVKIAENHLSVDAAEANDALKGKLSKKIENQNGNQPMKLRHSTPEMNKGRDVDAPSPLRRDSSSQAATNAVKEAKDLKHLADRLKNSGSNLESTALYFQAALKFLHGASLLESHGDMIQSTAMYSSTAKLCEFCAHEYEKSKEMAAAALAYKCTEVAYFKVVYSSRASACKDRHELQATLQIGTTGESPSSSASDLDNINNPVAVDKASIAKGANFPQVAGNHVIPVRNKSNLVRILNYAQDSSFAMEASKRSRIAFAAYGTKLEEAHHKESISAVKRALDFNFQDVKGLLRFVRLAMEVINR